jgi:hypothetical protein
MGSSNFDIFNSYGSLRILRSGYYDWNTNVDISTSSWQLVNIVRRSGNVFIYLNGIFQKDSNSNSMSFSASVDQADVYIGNNTLNGKLALYRLSATAPSAEQIKKIYEDEKVLFQENSKAVLAGTSDAVTALAYDDSNEELLVGTSQYLSVFKGLRRVEEVSGSVSAISASNGLRAVED